MYLQIYDNSDKSIPWNKWKPIIKYEKERFWSIILDKINETFAYIENFNVDSTPQSTYWSTVNKTDVIANVTGINNQEPKIMFMKYWSSAFIMLLILVYIMLYIQQYCNYRKYRRRHHFIIRRDCKRVTGINNCKRVTGINNQEPITMLSASYDWY